MIKQALYSILSSNPGVAALAQDRVFPNVIPQEDFDSVSQKPCVVYAREGVGRVQTQCNQSSSMVASIFRVDCYATSYDGAEALADSVRNALVDYSGTVGGVGIRTAILESEFDLVDIEPGLHRVSMQFTIWHTSP